MKTNSLGNIDFVMSGKASMLFPLQIENFVQDLFHIGCSCLSLSAGNCTFEDFNFYFN